MAKKEAELGLSKCQFLDGLGSSTKPQCLVSHQFRKHTHVVDYTAGPKSSLLSLHCILWNSNDFSWVLITCSMSPK